MYISYRGSLHRRLGDYNAAIDDFLLALDKCDHNEESPVYIDSQRQLLLTYNDFAVECFTKGFYEEAIILLNKAIKGEKREKGLYINRGGKSLYAILWRGASEAKPYVGITFSVVRLSVRLSRSDFSGITCWVKYWLSDNIGNIMLQGERGNVIWVCQGMVCIVSRSKGCRFESYCWQTFLHLLFSLASYSSQLDWTHTNEIKHGIHPR